MDNNIRRAIMIIALELLRRSLQLIEPLKLSESSTRQPRRQRGECGAEYIHRLLNENLTSCKEQLRLDSAMYVQLVDVMKRRKLLADSRYIKVDEQIGICLYILAKGASYRDVADRFMHSISTICKYFKKVLDALIVLSYDLIRPHRDLLAVSLEVENNLLYWPYFKDAIGALDGTHIEAIVRDQNGAPFRNRYGKKSWNVLASCSFDRIFTFINVGWEGSAHDITVWRDSLTNSKYVFPHPPKGKYYLVDSGYPNTLGYMSPISEGGARLHIQDYTKVQPEGIFEHFNYRHSSLRMKIEMSFGQLKKRWRVLKIMPQMPTKYQMSIIVFVFTLHNFIRMHILGIPIVDNNAYTEKPIDSDMYGDKRKNDMSKVRYKIAREIWRNIQATNGIDVEESESEVEDMEEDAN